MRLDLVFVLLAATISALCTPLPNSPASGSGAPISNDAHELVAGREELSRTALSIPKNGIIPGIEPPFLARTPVAFNNGGPFEDPIIKEIGKGLEHFRRDVSE